MKSFEGYEELMMDCSQILDELEGEFIKTAKKIIKMSDFYVDNDDLEESFSMIYRGLLAKESNETELINLAKKCFNDNVLLAKYTISACALSFMSNFILKGKLSYAPSLARAFTRFGTIFGASEPKFEEKEEQFLSNTISLDGGGLQLFGDIYSELENAKNQNHELHMLNLYQGVNISSKAQILENHQDSLLLKVDLMQLLAIKNEGTAYIIKDNVITCDLQAKIEFFDIASSTVKLGKLTRSTKTTAILRKFPRVHPNKLTPVRLSDDDGNYIDGRLFDLSQGGLGVVSEQSALWGHGQRLRAIFSLEIAGNTKQIALDIELVIALNYQGSMRYCCKLVDFSQPNIPDIIAFSDMRVTQTLEELKQKASL